MKFDWQCTCCGRTGQIGNPGLPITTLVNRAAIEHAFKSPTCKLAKEADVQIAPGRCVFSPMPHSRERKEDQVPKDN